MSKQIIPTTKFNSDYFVVKEAYSLEDAAFGSPVLALLQSFEDDRLLFAYIESRYQNSSALALKEIYVDKELVENGAIVIRKLVPEEYGANGSSESAKEKTKD